MESKRWRRTKMDLPGVPYFMQISVLLLGMLFLSVMAAPAALAAEPTSASGDSTSTDPAPPMYRLVVRVYPPDSGKVIKIPDKELYGHGEVVLLKAVPNESEGWEFSRWIGASGGPVTRVVMTGNRYVVAVFKRAEVELLLDTQPWGLALEAFKLYPEPIRILPTDDGRLHAIYRKGTFVMIFARDVDGRQFVQWRGDPPVDGPMIPEWIFMNPLPGYEMSRDKRLLAIYSESAKLRAKVDYDWVYQNTPIMTQWRHASMLKIYVANSADQLTALANAYEVSVRVHPASEGQVIVEPTRNPLVWRLKGARYSESRIGNVILSVSVKTREDEQRRMTLAVVKARILGDIDGNAEVNEIDLMLMRMRLAGEEVPGYENRHFDLTGDGLVNTIDLWLLLRAMHNAPIP